jgi:transposase
LLRACEQTVMPPLDQSPEKVPPPHVCTFRLGRTPFYRHEQSFGKWPRCPLRVIRRFCHTYDMSAIRLISELPVRRGESPNRRDPRSRTGASNHDGSVQMIDTSIVRVHKHGGCAGGGETRLMGRSRGGLTTKIHACVDTNGLPVRLELTTSEAHDKRLVTNLVSDLKSGAMLLADRGYDADWIRAFVLAHAACSPARSADHQTTTPGYRELPIGFQRVDQCWPVNCGGIVRARPRCFRRRW